jgi:formylglycine-generating enzyme required for sulfatase activity
VNRLGPVGKHEFDRSKAGVYDLAGSVQEWCQDFYEAGYYRRAPAEQPVCSRPALRRVVRGGSALAPLAPLARRGAGSLTERRADLGIRCVRDWPNGVGQ